MMHSPLRIDEEIDDTQCVDRLDACELPITKEQLPGTQFCLVFLDEDPCIFAFFNASC